MTDFDRYREKDYRAGNSKLWLAGQDLSEDPWFDDTIVYPSTTMADSALYFPGFPPTAWKPCNHERILKGASGYAGRDSGYHRVFLKDFHVKSSTALSMVFSNLGSYTNFGKMEFQKNNSFELIPAILDLDGTLAQFTMKFWKQISYGAINWGVLPFISDVKSLWNTLQDYNGRIAKELCTARKLEKTFPVKYVDPIFGHKFVGTLRSYGELQVDMPELTPADSAAIFLDEIGLNPDLKTVWDVLPLSFVVDYYFPVGDVLESAHPRGWFKPNMLFTGTCTLKGTWHENYGLYHEDWETQKIGPFASGKIYSRGFPAVFEPTGGGLDNIEWNAPNARQLFNTAYLALPRLHKMMKRRR